MKMRWVFSQWSESLWDPNNIMNRLHYHLWYTRSIRVTPKIKNPCRKVNSMTLSDSNCLLLPYIPELALLHPSPGDIQVVGKIKEKHMKQKGGRFVLFKQSNQRTGRKVTNLYQSSSNKRPNELPVYVVRWKAKPVLCRETQSSHPNDIENVDTPEITLVRTAFSSFGWKLLKDKC